MAQSFFFASGTWTAPAGVTSVTPEAWGTGGKGSTRSTNGGGGGGGGGAYAKTNSVAVTPTSSYNVNVATAQDSWFSNTGVAPTSTTEGVLAQRGGDVANNTTTGGTKGLASSSIGDTKYDGGTGGTSSGNGAGGGGGAGDAGNGGDGSNAAAGTAGTAWGGTGGGIQTGNADGLGGTPRGAGGGGARRTSGTRNGAGGAAGLVIVGYTPPDAYTIYPDGSWEGANDGSSTTITVPVKPTTGNQAGIVIIQHPDTRTITGVTWGGVAMTNEGTSSSGGGSKMTAFSLAACPTGVQNVVATSDSTGSNWRVQALSYVGVDQTDPVGEVVTGSTFGTSLTLSGMTATLNGSWGVAGFYTAGGGTSAGTNFVIRNPQTDPAVGDTDGPESAGDFSMTANGNSGTFIGIGLVLNPAVAPAATIPDARVALM